MSVADVLWLRGAENWGEWLTHPQALPAGSERVYMMRNTKGRVRFYAPGPALGGSQLHHVGPELPHIVAATYWAHLHHWVDPSMPMWRNIRCQTEVMVNSHDTGPIADDGRRSKRPWWLEPETAGAS